MCELAPPIFLAVVDRPLHVAFTSPTDLGLQLSTAMANYANKVIMGDFNADQLGSSHDAAFNRSLMSDLSLQLVAHGFTHVSGAAETWLDLCMVDESATIISWDKSAIPLGAGHHLVSVEIKVQGVCPKPKIPPNVA